MNVAMMCVYNTTPEQLEMTKEAVESVFNQDIPVDLVLIDNGSIGDTRKWAEGLRATGPHTVTLAYNETNESPVKVVNCLFKASFRNSPAQYILGVANDVILPSNFYRELKRWPRGIVTASMMGSKDVPQNHTSNAVNECTPMAVALIRKWAHDALVAKDGYFLDPGFFHYASDCDMALRMAACGFRGVQLDIPYYHYGSASWRAGEAMAAKAITDQADVDRAYFEKKWGFKVSDPQYGELAGNINFRGESRA